MLIKRSMSRPKPHYRVVVRNLRSQEQLKIELIDLPFFRGELSAAESIANGRSKCP